MMRLPGKLGLLIVILSAVTGCLRPAEKYLEEASSFGIYRQSIPEILEQGVSLTAGEYAGDLDLSGVYLSEITSDHHWYFPKNDRGLILYVRQSGNRIVALDSTYKVKIEGQIENGVVTFYVFPSRLTGGNSVSGEWSVEREAGLFRGTWRADSHSGSGDWNLRKLDSHGVELYTTESGKDHFYRIDEVEELFDGIFASDDPRNIVVYLHGRGDKFEKEFEDSGLPFIEDYSNTRFVFVRWLSWAGSSIRPYKYAIASSLGLSELLFALDEYKSRKPEVVGDRSITLLAHSMGNIPFQGFLEYLYQERDLQKGLFDAVILSSADLSVEGHRAWLEKCDFADEIFVIQHRGDLVLYLSEWFFTDDIEHDGRKLGKGFSLDSDDSDFDLAANTKYLDLTRLSLVNHKHFKTSRAAQLFRILLNGQKLDFPNPDIGLYRRAQNRPVYYFYDNDPDQAQDSLDR